MYIPPFCLFIHPLKDIWSVSTFWLLSSVATNVLVYVLLWMCVFKFFWVYSGSHGKSIFNFLRNHQNVIHSGWTILYSHQCMRVLIFPYPHLDKKCWFCLVVSLNEMGASFPSHFFQKEKQWVVTPKAPVPVSMRDTLGLAEFTPPLHFLHWYQDECLAVVSNWESWRPW